MGKRFEILDYVETPLGPLCLRRRELLAEPGTYVTEVTLDHEMLMSSRHTASEEALASLAITWHGGEGPLDALVGGLGLGYTAQAALADARVGEVRCVEGLPEVIGWLEQGLFPLAEQLAANRALTVARGDVYAQLLAPPERSWDLILIDVDHSPSEPLGPTSERFYTHEGLALAAEHMAPGGVLAVWSGGADDDAWFHQRLADVYAEATVELVRWENDLIDEGQLLTDRIFLARKAR